MNADQKTRLEIMKALEKDFPDRPLEDLVYMARYVEHGGVEPGPPKQTGHPSEQGAPRKWASLADIPDTVRLVEDHDGELIKRLVTWEQSPWVFVAHKYTDILPTDGDGPFIEVLS